MNFIEKFKTQIENMSLLINLIYQEIDSINLYGERVTIYDGRESVVEDKFNKIETNMENAIKELECISDIITDQYEY